MTFLLDFIRQKRILLKCLAISFLLHLSALIYFYTHPFIIHSSWKSLFGISSATPDTLALAEEEDQELIEKNKMIEDAFQHVFVLSPHLLQPLDLTQLPKGISISPNEELVEESVALEQIPIDSESLWEELEANDSLLTQETPTFHPDSLIQSLFIPEHSSWDLASQLQIDPIPVQAEDYSLPFSNESMALETSFEEDLLAVSNIANIPIQETNRAGVNLVDVGHLSDTLLESSDSLTTDPTPMLSCPSAISIPTEQGATSHSYLLSQAQPEVQQAKKLTSSSFHLPQLEDYQLPHLAMATSWNDDFKVELKFLPQEERPGYLFSIALTSDFDLSQFGLKQNVYFIIDRSNSIQKHRFAVFKRAVIKALGSMQKDDVFNIYVIDKKVTKFTSSPLRVSAKSIQAAEEFLNKQEAGSMFAASDIYASLDKILPEIPASDEFHTAILLTDGNTLHDNAKQQHVLVKWLEKNSGKISLYTAAVGQKNNLMMLDLISCISGGKLLYSDTHASFPRKLAKLILDLKNPIAKDLMIAAVPEYSNAQIEFYSASPHLPSLYGNQPYVIYGYIDEPCNFDLIIQGRHGDEWIAIKKNISFIDGVKGTKAFEKQWKAQQANVYYSKFLKEGKTAHLKEAKQILKTNRSEIAFE